MVARKEPEITAAVETVTPEIAQRWLSTLPQEGNRDRMKSHVDFIAGQILQGRWRVNGEGIILTALDGLLDGQHRCRAIVQADKPVRTLVVRGVLPEDFGTIDTGVTRNAGHVLQIRGRKNSTNLAAALRLVVNYGDNQFAGSRARIPNSRLLDIDEANPGLSDSVAWSMSVYQSMRQAHLWKVPVAAFAHFFLSETCAKKDTLPFFDALTDLDVRSGQDMAGIAALALRKRLAAAYTNRERLTLQETLASFVLAWNALAERHASSRLNLVWLRPKIGQPGATFPRFKTK